MLAIIEIILLLVLGSAAILFLGLLIFFRTWRLLAVRQAKGKRGWRWYNTEWTPRYNRLAEPLFRRKVAVPLVLIWVMGVSVVGLAGCAVTSMLQA